jgi:hypothetical protein
MPVAIAATQAAIAAHRDETALKRSAQLGLSMSVMENPTAV